MGRLQFQAVLEALLETSQVYFQPPATVEMQYPCIVYKRDRSSTDFADNYMYRFHQRYEVTHISRSPDSDIRGKLGALPMSLYNRYFTAQNLHHDVFLVYFGGVEA